MIEELQNILTNSIKKKQAAVEHKIIKKLHLREIEFVESSLKREAKKGNDSIKIVGGSISSEAIEFFKREGFIVFENSEIIYIKIPTLQ